MTETHDTGARGLTHAALRIAAGLAFASHGAQKLFGWFGGFGPNGGTAELVSQFGVAGMIELAGGVLLVVGLFTRPVAFIASGEMAVAYVVSHWAGSGQMFWWANHGEVALLYAFIWLMFAAWGAGPLSIDALRQSPAPQVLHQREEFA